MLSPQSTKIRLMFSSIARRYDLLNHLLSLNIDKSWRRRAVSLLSQSLRRNGALCLDLCCGTGDLALEIIHRAEVQVVGCDFSHSMLKLGQEKILRRQVAERVRLVEADALNLPFRSGTFDATAIAFGLRNLDSVEAGLNEMCRILRPGGHLVVLEFSRPSSPLFAKLFSFYFFRILPRIGNWISRHNHAYSYLPESVSQFPDQEDLAGVLARCGFEKVSFSNLTGGIAALHYAQKKNRS